ncbi:pectate lyase [Cellvibrio sp. ARAG 10.3]|uniref:pectate lyase n=1 Tax=Cellvibrio sp. ARAG 10.3 TaxID=3451358 RepID=UPI003F478A79
MLKKLLFSFVVLSLSASVFAAKNRPDGYVTICKIGETCFVSSSTNVAFGASDKFVYKVLSGSFSCSVATFGSDPNPAKSVKECSIPSGSSGGGASSSSSSSGGSSGGGSSSSSGGGNSGSITGASCSANGSTTVNSTIRVTSGTYDGSCRVHNAGSALGDGSQSESQQPVFRVENGATLRNVIIGNNGADGIHVYNGGNIDNVTWQNVGEDALTIKSSGTVNVTNIEGYDADDKFFQVNAASTLRVSNCIIRNAGKALRQNGGTTYKIDVAFDRCDISGMKEGVFRTDSSTSVARITNSRLKSGTTICIGFRSGNCTSSGITYY